MTADGDCSHEIKRCLLFGRKAMTNLDSIIKKTLPCQQRSLQSKLWFFQLSCLDVTIRLERKLSVKELMLLNCGVGEDSWESLGQKGDAEAVAQILWSPKVKNWLIRKDPEAGKDWGQEEKGTTEDKMVERHHWIDRHESEQAPGVGDGQGSLVCCSPWGHKELHRTEQLN